tara:strand:- start:2135 stop:2371 length:237 start_codon:yes stop_codon:yes gene_type:complete
MLQTPLSDIKKIKLWLVDVAAQAKSAHHDVEWKIMWKGFIAQNSRVAEPARLLKTFRHPHQKWNFALLLWGKYNGCTV